MFQRASVLGGTVWRSSGYSHNACLYRYLRRLGVKKCKVRAQFRRGCKLEELRRRHEGRPDNHSEVRRWG